MTHPSHRASLLENAHTDLFIDGSFDPATGQATFDVVNPADAEVLCAVADATPADGMRALEAAAAAQSDFAATSAVERHQMLLTAYRLMMERQDDLALLMTLEMGKPVAESAGEIAYAAEFFRHYAAEALRGGGGYQPTPQGGARFILARQPVGPCLLITPWNFPMAMGTRKIGPALAAGCACVIKPAQQTPLSMLALAGILREAGVPDGVVNVIPTSDSGGVMEPMITSGLARKLSFTGSTKVGKVLLKQSADKVLRTSMELGGNAPFLVFDDADLDEAVAGCMQAKMRNMGEACTAANRIYVQSGVHDAFVEKLTEQMSQLKVGDGTLDDSTVGPLIDSSARDDVHALVSEALQGGARLHTGGTMPEGSGYFYPPTVLTDVPADARITAEEIFGPVAAVISFETEDEAVAAANDTEFGLVAYAYTNDLRRGLRVAERIEAGMVGLNQGVVSNAYAPFGGIKESGLGREGGAEGIEEYLETKYIGVTM
ncbi:MAG: NAD-dependent succinate-semialdehyde dehydrogenase [Ornithinimicrobium sp.]